MLLIDHHTITQLNTLTKDTYESLTQQRDVMLFQIFIYELTWHLNQQCLTGRLIGLKYYRTEPSIVLLLGNILLYKLETLIPKLFRIDVHIDIYVTYVFLQMVC